VSTNPEDPGSNSLKFLLNYMPTLTAQKWGKALVFFAPSLKGSLHPFALSFVSLETQSYGHCLFPYLRE